MQKQIYRDFNGRTENDTDAKMHSGAENKWKGIKSLVEK